MVIACGGSAPNDPPISENAKIYMSEYGGELIAYQRILSLNNCQELQDEFEISSSNNDQATAGSDIFKITLGYMHASNERMDYIGCFD